jgi:hypothetical protein
VGDAHLFWGGSRRVPLMRAAERPPTTGFAANALLRGGIDSVLAGEAPKELLRELLDNTSLANLAAACGYQEGELAISWSDFLTNEEKEAVRCGAK